MSLARFCCSHLRKRELHLRRRKIHIRWLKQIEHLHDLPGKILKLIIVKSREIQDREDKEKETRNPIEKEIDEIQNKEERQFQSESLSSFSLNKIGGEGRSSKEDAEPTFEFKVVTSSNFDRYESDIRRLFTEYGNYIVDSCEETEDVHIDPEEFKFGERDIKTEFFSKDGFILLVKENDEIAGCIALSRLSQDECEMKRLYVSPKFRGRALGNKLCNELLQRAKSAGFKRMKLVTSTIFGQRAIDLYKSLGFNEIPRFCETDLSDVFMEKDLDH
ncbi:GNAT family N-acetyltransferase [Candidatus Dojkabacteria bacterium]|nr:GNAT family N-acetyltransferase [Candidatus Dojkabacteria bacterium]